jgi:tight adherence protein B
MQMRLFPILLAAAVSALVWALCVALLGGDSRKRVAQRLSSDGNSFRAAGQIQSILLESGGMTGLGKLLTRKIFFQKVQKQLAVTYPRTSLSRFVLFTACIGVTAFVVALLAVDSLMVAAATGTAIGYVPFMVLNVKVAKRSKTINEQLPESLDFLARILRAGHSLSTGLQMMGTELPDPLASEFRRCYDQHSLGAPLQDCLKDMALRVESTEFSFFVTAVLIQRQTGGDLSTVLGNISATIRGRIRLAGFVKSKTAEGRFTGYVLVFFPILMFFVAYSLNPSYGGKLLHTGTGQKLLGTAIALQVIGLYAIKKLTTVKV